jgi:hypothetical protein
MSYESKWCDDCGGVGIVGDPSNKPGSEVKTIPCGTCGGTGSVPVAAGQSVSAEPTLAFEQMEQYALAQIAADRILRKEPMPKGWEASIALPQAPSPRIDAVPGLGIGPLYGMDDAQQFGSDAVAADRAACERLKKAAARYPAKAISFKEWFKEITVEGSVEFNMERAWSEASKRLLEALIGDLLDETRVGFENHCRSIGKNDRDLERASAYSARITGNDYTWGDINMRWDSWKAATAAEIARQMASDQ